MTADLRAHISDRMDKCQSENTLGLCNSPIKALLLPYDFDREIRVVDLAYFCNGCSGMQKGRSYGLPSDGRTGDDRARVAPATNAWLERRPGLPGDLTFRSNQTGQRERRQLGLAGGQQSLATMWLREMLAARFCIGTTMHCSSCWKPP